MGTVSEEALWGLFLRRLCVGTVSEEALWGLFLRRLCFSSQVYQEVQKHKADLRLKLRKEVLSSSSSSSSSQ